MDKYKHPYIHESKIHKGFSCNSLIQTFMYNDHCTELKLFNHTHLLPSNSLPSGTQCLSHTHPPLLNCLRYKFVNINVKSRTRGASFGLPLASTAETLNLKLT